MTQSLEVAFGTAVERIADIDNLVRVILQGNRRSLQPKFSHVEIRPVKIKDRILLQVAENDGRQTYTSNKSYDELDIESLLRSGYSNIRIDSFIGSISIQITKKDSAIIHSAQKPLERKLEHDRIKDRFLDSSDPYLIEVGISDFHGNVKPSRQDKYRQVEDFLKLLIPTIKSAISSGQLDEPTAEKPLKIVDLGCGNAYLTFAAHQYLRSQGYEVHVTGVDAKKQSRVRNSEIAKALGIEKTIEFVESDISRYPLMDASVVVALHACDTATDDAIAWGAKVGAEILLVAPCCHHDLQIQMNEIPEPWKLLTRHGLMKERLGDLITDSLRAQILKLLGYRSEIIEFVGDNHTPRNLMIRALKTSSVAKEKDLAQYEEMLTLWNVKPALAELLHNSLKELKS